MAFFDFLVFTKRSQIGGVVIQASIEEVMTDTLQVTEHPVELGAPITDHAYNRPSEVVIRAGWTNSSVDSLIDTATRLFGGGEVSDSDTVGGVYSQLLALKESREPFDITTTKRQYRNMLMTSLAVTTDQKTGNVLMVTATCRQVFIVKTQATTLPAREAQADPAATAETENVGAKQSKPGATPSPGGAAPSINW